MMKHMNAMHVVREGDADTYMLARLSEALLEPRFRDCIYSMCANPGLSATYPHS